MKDILQIIAIVAAFTLVFFFSHDMEQVRRQKRYSELAMQEYSKYSACITTYIRELKEHISTDTFYANHPSPTMPCECKEYRRSYEILDSLEWRPL